MLLKNNRVFRVVSMPSFGALSLHFNILLQNCIFLKKALCSPQTKINYLESFLNFFSHCLHFRGYFTFFKISIFHNVVYYILHTGILMNYIPLDRVYLFSRKSCPPSKRSFSFVKRIHSSKRAC